VNRLWKFELAATVALCAALAPIVSADARGVQPQNPAAAQQAQMEAQRQAQERAIQAQQQQARAMQEQEMKAQQEARASQEQALKAQEENARKSQQQAMQAQQEAARRQQEQVQQAQRQQQEQAQRAQQEAQRQQQNAQQQFMKAQQKAQQQAQRQAQEMAQRQQQEAMKQQQEAQRQQQKAMRQQQTGQSQREQKEQAQAMERAQEQGRGREAELPHVGAANLEGRGAGVQSQVRENERGGGGMPPHAPNMLAGIAPGGGHGAAMVRPPEPKALTFSKAVPIQKAISMPVVEGVPSEQNEHAQAVLKNLQEHLVAVPGNEAPRNFNINRSNWLNNYTNNYWANINSQRFFINRQNTYINSVLPNDYPYWYQQQPGWVFSNGFVLGNSIRCGLDWLRWGWHPYYGPQPDGFVCASDYIPTPWIYFPAYGLWQQPGVFSWAPSGPPYDYTGPITVEVLEPRHVHVRDPYSGWENQQVVNVVYLYNAFYDEEYEHWGYTNRHGYFIWLNI
jgi:hypothetical protein